MYILYYRQVYRKLLFVIQTVLVNPDETILIVVFCLGITTINHLLIFLI